MATWFKKRDYAYSVKDRTEYQKVWDSAVLAAAEYIRQRTGDEHLTLEMLELQTPIRN